jgi:HD-GYP domain-containing protein (c-di-GMP phosphodiesterase class II)
LFKTRTLAKILSFQNSERNQLPLRTKITIPYLFLAILIAIGAAFLVSNIVFSTVEERFYNQLGEVGKLTSEQMVVEEDKLLETLRFLTHSENISNLISQNDPEKLRTMAIGIAINQQADAIEFLDKDGYLVLSMRHNEGSTIEDYTYVYGEGSETIKSLEFVNKVLNNQEDDLGNKYAGFVEADWGKYFYVSGPIYDESGQIQGAILVGTRLRNLALRMHANIIAQITIYSKDGNVLDTSFPIHPDPLDNALSSSILAIQDETRSKIRGFEDQRDISITNLDYYEILGPWEVRGDSDLGIIGAALQENFIIKQSPVSRIQITAIIAIALFLVIMVGISLANAITKPITELVTASQNVANGNLDVQVDLNTHDEITVLAQSFNQMISNLSQSRADILDAYDKSLEGWTKALELRDKETEGHTQRVTNLTVELATFLGIKGNYLVNIQRGAMLHDIGKMGIPDKILHKPGPLDDEEWVLMKQHPVFAYEMLKDIRFLDDALEIPHFHHEHWDGGGYPMGLSQKQIPISARIFSVVDSWDALTNDRPYRGKLSNEVAMNIIQEESGKKHDPYIVDIFREYLGFSVEPEPKG